VSSEQYLSLRNFLILNKKFFGIPGEKNAVQILKRYPDQELASCALQEYERYLKATVSISYEGRTHDNVKVLGLGRFHNMRPV
jgi:hypothetical protein